MEVQQKVESKTKASAEHPPYFEMVKSAINTLHEKNGSSRQAIIKYIDSHYQIKAKQQLELQVKKILKSAVLSGKFIQTKGTGASGSFKLAASEKKTEKKTSSSKSKVIKSPAKKVSVAKKAVKKRPSTPNAKTQAAKLKKAAVKKAAASVKKTKPLSPKKPVAKKPATPKKARKAKA